MLAWGENGLRHMTNSKHTIATAGRSEGPQDPCAPIRCPVERLPGARRGHRIAAVPANCSRRLRAGKFRWARKNPIATIPRSGKYSIRWQKFLTLNRTRPTTRRFFRDVRPMVFDDLSAEDRKELSLSPPKLGRRSLAQVLPLTRKRPASPHCAMAGMTLQTGIEPRPLRQRDGPGHGGFPGAVRVRNRIQQIKTDRVTCGSHCRSERRVFRWFRYRACGCSWRSPWSANAA